MRRKYKLHVYLNSWYEYWGDLECHNQYQVELRRKYAQEAYYRALLGEGVQIPWQQGRASKLDESEQQLEPWGVWVQGPCMITKVLKLGRRKKKHCGNKS